MEFSAWDWPLWRRKGDAADRGTQKEKRPPQGGLMLEQWKYQQIWQAIWCWDIRRISFSGGS